MIMLLRRCFRWQYSKVPRHAKVDDQRAMVETDQQVFPASRRGSNHAAGQAICKIVGKRPAQPAVPQGDASDNPAFKMRGNASARDFNFG